MDSHSIALQEEAYRRYQAGDTKTANELCRRLVEKNPRHAEAIYLLGVIEFDAGQLQRAGEFFSQAAQLAPENAVFVNAEGEAHFSAGRIDDATRCFRRAISARPAYERAHNNLGRALHAQGNLSAAAASFAEAVRLNPKYATAQNNLGGVFQAEGKLDAAMKQFRRALELKRDYPEAHFNLGAVLSALGNPAAALLEVAEAVRLRPGYVRAHALLGQTLINLGKVAASEATLRTVVRLSPEDPEGYLHLGDVLTLLGKLDEAATVYDQGLSLAPDHVECFAHRFRLKEQLCEWSSREKDLVRLWGDVERELSAGRPAPLPPLHAMSLPWSREQQLAIARGHAKGFETAAARMPAQAPAVPARTGRLKVAYLSRDFYDHPVSHLIGPLFGLHDRSDFEIHAYSFGPDDASTYRQRIARECEHFHDVTHLTADQLDARIRSDGIHVLIDLMAYTGLARTVTLARRPAPIQVSWLGYAGTMGADFIDYIIGDARVTPAEHAAEFSEKIVRLPHSYLIVDRDQSIDSTPIQRRDHGLPDGAIVFCCFNNSHKIDPEIFEVWMKILGKVPGSVLWLSVQDAGARANLRREAQARSIDPARLVFAGHLPSKAMHLSRHRLADLFLDAHSYNAHATGCDALWAGLPILTCPGPTFAARVGSSLLTAAGLPELIVPNLTDYERMAVRLGNNPEELRALREKLEANHNTAPLFDTPRFVRNLERAYTAMWTLHASGQRPQSIDVTE